MILEANAANPDFAIPGATFGRGGARGRGRGRGIPANVGMGTGRLVTLKIMGKYVILIKTTLQIPWRYVTFNMTTARITSNSNVWYAPKSLRVTSSPPKSLLRQPLHRLFRSI